MSKRKEKEHGYDDGSYVIKKSRKSSLFAFILCLLIAFAIWLYAANKEQQRIEEGVPTDTESLYTESGADLPSASLL